MGSRRKSTLSECDGDLLEWLVFFTDDGQYHVINDKGCPKRRRVLGFRLRDGTYCPFPFDPAEVLPDLHGAVPVVLVLKDVDGHRPTSLQDPNLVLEEVQSEGDWVETAQWVEVPVVNEEGPKQFLLAVKTSKELLLLTPTGCEWNLHVRRFRQGSQAIQIVEAMKKLRLIEQAEVIRRFVEVAFDASAGVWRVSRYGEQSVGRVLRLVRFRPRET
jgi:hypothetical protein